MTERWTYDNLHRKHPHVHPLATPSGRILTRDAPDSHPWHHGLWFAVKFVNGDNFWEEVPPYGVQRHVDDTTLHWIAPDRATVAVVERRTIAEVDIGDDAYALDWSSDIAVAVDTVFDTTPFTTWGGYSGLTLRGRADWSDTRFLLADGSTHERVLGTPSPWCDLSGRVDEADAGVLLLHHPDNPRHPVPWYGSNRAPNYGDGWANFVSAAFLWDGPLHVRAGDALHFRYRVVVHDDAWSQARCACEWERFAGAPTKNGT